jgi:epoxyqueuosine reductase
VLERYWARRAGLASVGKNGLGLRRDAGSAFFLGTIVTGAPFPAGQEHNEDLCGDCERCLNACPTGALVSPFVLDARRCLSYLTIENRGAIPPARYAALGDGVFGCDRCQDACPYNRSIRVPGHPDFRPRPPLAAPCLSDILFWDDPAFNEITKNSPLARATRLGLQRNCLIAARNLGKRRLVEICAARGSTPELQRLAGDLLASTFR